MALFNYDPADYGRLDYRILLNSPIALYYDTALFHMETQWFEDDGYEVHRFDCLKWTTDDAFHDNLATELSFPDYYGRNLNAFNDCIGYLEISEQRGLLLAFERFDDYAKRESKAAWHVLDIIATQARQALLFGRRLIAIAQSDDPRLEFDSVGACPVMWNFKEWFQASRGI